MQYPKKGTHEAVARKNVELNVAPLSGGKILLITNNPHRLYLYSLKNKIIT
jgi:hypothetical protein